MRELELHRVGPRGRLAFDLGDEVGGVDVPLRGAEVMLEQVFQFEAILVAQGAVLGARLRVAGFDVERLTPLGLVGVRQHAHVGDLEAVEAQPFARGVVEVAVVEIERELFVGREADLIFGLQVEAAVAGIVARAEVAAESGRGPLDDFAATGLGRFGEVGVAERVVAGRRRGGRDEEERSQVGFHGGGRTA